MLFKRSNTYYFRWQLPAHLKATFNKHEFVISLRTGDIITAKCRALRYEDAISNIKNLTKAKDMGEITLENYQEAMLALWESMRSPTYERKFHPVYEQQRAKAIARLEDKIREYRVVTETRSGQLHPNQEEAATPYELVGSDLMEDLNHIGISSIETNAIDLAIKDYAQLKLSLLTAIRDSINPNTTKEPSLPDWLTNLPETTNSGQNTTLSTRNQWSNTEETLLNVAWTQFQREKKARASNPNIKTFESRDKEFSDFLEIIGGDMPIRDVDRDIALRFVEAIKKFPAHRGRRYPGLPLKQIPPSAEALSESSASQRITNIAGFFKWAVTLNYINKNPFDGLKLTAEKRSYATYTGTDLKELFNLPSTRIRKSWQFWIPRIALYTGARQNEIAQLLTKDVLTAEDGTWYFNITDLEQSQSIKTKAGRRIVPIHQALLDNGFLAYLENVRSSNSESLWPSLKPKSIKGKLGATVSDYWLRLKQKHRIPSNPTDEDGHSKVFHSLRRVAINRLKNAGVEVPIIQTIVGHEQSMLGETRTYLDRPPISVLTEAINKIDIDNISWEHPLKLTP